MAIKFINEKSKNIQEIQNILGSLKQKPIIMDGKTDFLRKFTLAIIDQFKQDYVPEIKDIRINSPEKISLELNVPEKFKIELEKIIPKKLDIPLQLYLEAPEKINIPRELFESAPEKL